MVAIKLLRHCYVCKEYKTKDNFRTTTVGRKKSGEPVKGLRSICNQCQLGFDKIRDKSGYQRIALKRYRQNPRNIIKIKARSAVHKALKDGLLIKPNKCEKCDVNEHIHAHHPDYTKPLKVSWLCRNHHYQLHKIHA